MILEEELPDAGASRLQGSPRRSHVAQELARWGAASCRFASYFAVLCLLATGAFIVLTPEPLGQRLITLVFLGLPSALAAIQWVGSSAGFL
jgi:hypothetical protein